MTADLLPLPLPTLPGMILGVVALDGQITTVQCSRCYATKTGTPIVACGFALFPAGPEHQQYDSRGNWVSGERLCRDCRKACGCRACKSMWST